MLIGWNLKKKKRKRIFTSDKSKREEKSEICGAEEEQIHENVTEVKLAACELRS